MTRRGAWNVASLCSLVVSARSVFPGCIMSSVGTLSALVSRYVSVALAMLLRLLQQFTVFLMIVVLRFVVRWVQSVWVARGVEKNRLRPRSLMFNIVWRNTGLTQLGFDPNV